MASREVEEMEVDSARDEQQQKEDQYIQEVKEDQFPAADTSGVRVPEKEEKPTHYYEQILLADILIERIKLILRHHHGGKTLEQFTAMDFRIFTANDLNLQHQTIERLIKPHVGCIPNHVLKKGDEYISRYASQRVKKYEHHTSLRSDLDELEKEVEMQKDTLFIMVCDEGHWGATKDGAYQRMVNRWNSSEHPNVFLLLVTATPYNILTSQSRIPQHVFSYDEQGEAVIVEDTGPRTRRHASLTTDQKHLNVVWWTEVIHEVIKKGLVMRLRVPVEGSTVVGRQNLPWLGVREASDSMPSPIIVKDDREDSCEFLFRGAERNVTISLVSASNMILCVKDRKLGFLSEHEAEQDPAVITKFEVSVACGMGLIGLKASNTNQRECYVNYSKETKSLVMAGYSADIPPFVPNVLANREPHTLLLCDSCYMPCMPHDNQTSKFYVPLNYYFSTMKNERKQEQLIREDPVVTGMYKKLSPKSRRPAKKKHDEDDFANGDLLIAEYAMFVLLMPFMQQCKFSTEIVDVNQLISKLPDALGDDYASHINELLKKFPEKLPVKGSEKLIPRKTFNAAVEYYKEMVKEDVQNAFKSGEDVITALLHALFLLNKVELCELQKELQPQLKHVSQIGHLSLNMDRDREKAVMVWETARIIQDLFFCYRNPGEGERELSGKMVVIRTDMTAAQRMYGTLCKARLSALEYAHKQKIEYPVNFEILSDHSKQSLTESYNVVSEEIKNTAIFRIKRKLQPQKCEYRKPDSLKPCYKRCKEYKSQQSSLQCCNCSHEHRVIKTYEDLHGLPCILILVSKGRMGHTFPKSFTCMDLRLCRGTNKPLSTVAQELGRLCRYVPKDATDPLPYCLISAEVSKFMRRDLHLRVALHSCFKQLDRHVKVDDNQETREIEARESHADYGYENKGDQQNRLLLSAEPQIGKTGAYLCIISKLRETVERNVAISPPSPPDSSSDNDVVSEPDGEDEDDNEDIPHQEFNHDWLYPQKVKLEPLKFKHEVHSSKYTRLTGPYDPDKTPRIQLKPKHVQQVNRTKVLKPQYGGKQEFVTFDRRHTVSCATCSLQDSNIDDENNDAAGVKIYIPKQHETRSRFQALVDKCSEKPTGDLVGPSCDVWIFTPTYDRALVANVNLLHTMTQNGEVVQHIHLLVVRSKDFKVYKQEWGGTHAIVELPETMEDCYNDVDQGGIGYARRFILRLAQRWNLPYIFMMDDNLVTQFEVETHGEDENAVILREEGYLKMKSVPLWHLLSHFKMLMQPENDDKAHEMGSANFAVVGTCRRNQYVGRISRPFTRHHCAALTMLNVNLLKEKNITYKDWPVWEDLNLNSRCERAGAWVVRVSRFQIYKKSLRTWLPKMYVWDDEDDLHVAAAGEDRQPAEDELDILIRYVYVACSPARVKELPCVDKGSAADTAEELHRKLEQQILQKKRPQDWHLLVCPVHSEGRHQLEDQLRSYLTETSGIGGYKYHSLILMSSTCTTVGLCTKGNITNCLNKYFDVKDLNVYTTHKPDVYDVKYILVNIEGRILNARDNEAVDNILRPPSGHLMLEQIDSFLPCKHRQLRVIGTISVEVCSKSSEDTPMEVKDMTGVKRKIEDCRRDQQKVELIKGPRFLISFFLIYRYHQAEKPYYIILDDGTSVKKE